VHSAEYYQFQDNIEYTVVVIVLKQVEGLAMSLALAKLKLQVEDFLPALDFNFDCDIICYDSAPRMAMAISWPQYYEQTKQTLAKKNTYHGAVQRLPAQQTE
jgi:hypothetical protein